MGSKVNMISIPRTISTCILTLFDEFLSWADIDRNWNRFFGIKGLEHDENRLAIHTLYMLYRRKIQWRVWMVLQFLIKNPEPSITQWGSVITWRKFYALNNISMMWILQIFSFKKLRTIAQHHSLVFAKAFCCLEGSLSSTVTLVVKLLRFLTVIMQNEKIYDRKSDTIHWHRRGGGLDKKWKMEWSVDGNPWRTMN